MICTLTTGEESLLGMERSSRSKHLQWLSIELPRSVSFISQWVASLPATLERVSNFQFTRRYETESNNSPNQWKWYPLIFFSLPFQNLKSDDKVFIRTSRFEPTNWCKSVSFPLLQKRCTIIYLREEKWKRNVRIPYHYLTRECKALKKNCGSDHKTLQYEFFGQRYLLCSYKGPFTPSTFWSSLRQIKLARFQPSLFWDCIRVVETIRTYLTSRLEWQFSCVFLFFFLRGYCTVLNQILNISCLH